ncbi:hypothetical protein Dimus_003235, partial [Dionaea muscipula]
EIEIKALPIDLIWRKRVIRSKVVRENWMIDNGLENVMEIIKRQKWEKLFRRRELVHIDAVKEFYAKLTMSHNRKKDVARSKVRGVEIEFDHQKLASILGIPGNNGICERRDDVMEAPAENVHEEEVEDQNNFDWEAVIDEAADEGELGLGEKFYDAEDEIQEPTAVVEEVSAVVAQASAQQKERAPSGVDPSGPSGRIPEVVMNKLQAKLERARANRFQVDLEKAQV